jgi:hypothetical protein
VEYLTLRLGKLWRTSRALLLARFPSFDPPADGRPAAGLWTSCGKLPSPPPEKVCVIWVMLWITLPRPISCSFSNRNSRRPAWPGPEAAAQESDLNRKALALPVETSGENSEAGSTRLAGRKPDAEMFPDHPSRTISLCHRDVGTKRGGGRCDREVGSPGSASTGKLSRGYGGWQCTAWRAFVIGLRGQQAAAAILSNSTQFDFTPLSRCIAAAAHPSGG